jgi:hypothetical protein
VIANRDIHCGEIVTVFGDTTYIQESTREGTELSRLHARMHEEDVPLQYTFQGHLAESNNVKIWAVPEPDKGVIRAR